jgi:type II secretory ATPase GspE/PulE/Tfp pilus assembly ATPase PilB-like protein/FixJ family two-component response regulator
MSRLAQLFLGQDQPASPTGKDTPVSEKPAYKILFVDDEPHVLKAMRRIFRRENYVIQTASSGPEALKLLEEATVQVVVSDHRMPGMSGADLLRKIKSLWPETIRIMLTGHADVLAVMGAINEGAVYKFITKPWNDEDLRVTVGLALEQYDLIRENTALKKQQEEQKKKIKNLTRAFASNRSQIGRVLVARGELRQDELDRAVSQQARTNKVLPLVLMELGLTDEKKLITAMEAQLRLSRVSPAEFTESRALAPLIPKDLCETHLLVPLQRVDGQLLVAMADPTDIIKIDELRFLTGMPVKPAIATITEIREKIRELYGSESTLETAMSEIEITDPTESIEIILEEEDEQLDINDLLRSKDQPPAIRMVNAIISDALRHGSSDVHIEPKTKYILVRYRIDDLLHEKLHIPITMHASIVSRIKVLCELDITERRKPQDGRVTVKTQAKTVDLRISTLPTVNGEKVVFRILDKNAASLDLKELGLSDRDYTKICRFIKQPQGMVLATGPTGSGKTSTLYSMLRQGATTTKNFTTIEDPVEYFMNMAEQVNVREKIGLNFPTILRSILRQDPNVIMLGEIRDHQTAEVAFHAALTGHLVLSTLHTNGSIASIVRLRDMGIKSYVISEALTGIIAQRLVRRNCRHCLTEYRPDPETLRELGVHGKDLEKTFRKGSGCARCYGSGYKGRVGIYEVLEFNQELRRMVHGGASDSELMRGALQANMTTIYLDAMDKVGNGWTTCEEVLRVLGPQNILDISCPHCGARLAERYNFCPCCTRPIILRCAACQTFLEEDWRACPNCGVLTGK